MSRKLAVVFYYRRQNRYGLAALAGALEADPLHEQLDVRFIRHEGELLRSLPLLLESHDRVVVGVSFFSTQVDDAGALVKKLRSRGGEKVFLAAGGPHPSGDPGGTLGLGFDAAVIGEGEVTFREILGALRRGEDWRALKGLAWLDGEGRCRRTGRRSPVNLDDCPPWSVKHRKYGPIEITRGCPHGCTFCQTTYLFGNKVRHRSLEGILGLVRQLKGREITDIRFISPSAFAWGSPDGLTADPGALEALLRGVRDVIGPSGRIYLGSFPSEVRPEHVTPETIGLVRRWANNDNLVIGAQSGSPAMLEATRRGHSLEDVRRAVDLAVGAGLKVNVDFIFGLPGESPEDVRLTGEAIRELAGRGALIHAHTFMPLPGTPLASSPPGVIDRELRETVRELVAGGFLFGEWHRQERQAAKMATRRRPPAD